MSRKISRRKFILYGSATLGTTILLKACGSNTTPTAQTPAANTTTAANTTPAANATPAANTTPTTAPVAASGDTIKVGILHSLSGTMAISEKSVVDAEQLAIEEINKSGGVLGKQIQPIVERRWRRWSTSAPCASWPTSSRRICGS